MWDLLLQGTANGLMTGVLFGLVAVGLTLVFGVMKIINFAHGEFLMIAMYTTYVLSTVGGQNPYLATLVAVPFLFLLGAATFELLIKPLLAAPETSQLMITLGLMIFLQNLALLIFKGDPLSVSVPWAVASLHLGAVSLSLTRVITAVACLIATLGVYWLLKSTDAGRMMRAAAEDRNAAQLMGINVNRMYMLALGLGVACLGVAGPFLLPWSFVSPDVGSSYGLPAYIIVVLGSLGSVTGALFGGVIIGVASGIGQTFLPGTYGLIPQYLLFILLMLFRPQGLFPRRI